MLRRAPLERALPDATIDADAARAAPRAPGAAARRRDARARRRSPRIAVARRPELAELAAALDSSAAQEDVARAAFKPRVAFALDAGSQGEHYALGDDERFVLASLVVRFSAYSGGANSARLRASRAATDALAARREQATLGIRLEVQRALEDLEVADASLDTAAQRVAAAEVAFTIVSRKRDLGQINQTEFIDARNALDRRAAESEPHARRCARAARRLEYSIGLGLRRGTTTRQRTGDYDDASLYLRTPRPWPAAFSCALRTARRCLRRPRRRRDAPVAEAIRSVHVVEVRAATGDASVRAVGRARAQGRAQRSRFKIGGVIERIEVDEGDAVHRGELLAVLERTEIDAAVERAAESAGKAERDLEATRALYAEDVATLEQVEHLGRLR